MYRKPHPVHEGDPREQYTLSWTRRPVPAMTVFVVARIGVAGRHRPGTVGVDSSTLFPRIRRSPLPLVSLDSRTHRFVGAGRGWVGGDPEGGVDAKRLKMPKAQFVMRTSKPRSLIDGCLDLCSFASYIPSR